MYFNTVCQVELDETSYEVIESAGIVRVCLNKVNNVQLSGPVNLLVSTGPGPADPAKDPAGGMYAVV